MGRDSRKMKPVTTQVLEPEMRRFLWDSLQEAKYGAAARKMIKVKAKQVLIFLEVLESSLSIEEQVYSDQKTLPRPPHTSKRTPVVHWSRLSG